MHIKKTMRQSLKRNAEFAIKEARRDLVVCRQSPFSRRIEDSLAVKGRSASVSSALEKGFGVGGVGSAGFWKPSVSGRAIVIGIAKA